MASADERVLTSRLLARRHKRRNDGRAAEGERKIARSSCLRYRTSNACSGSQKANMRRQTDGHFCQRHTANFSTGEALTHHLGHLQFLTPGQASAHPNYDASGQRSGWHQPSAPRGGWGRISILVTAHEHVVRLVAENLAVFAEESKAGKTRSIC